MTLLPPCLNSGEMISNALCVVIAKDDVKKFIELAKTENLKATPVATVTDTKRLVMEWNGHKIVDISREFLDTNGAEKHTTVETGKAEMLGNKPYSDFHSAYNPAQRFSRCTLHIS